MVNHLANETSPYLLQHSNNPVDWYPWGQAALDKARTEDKPIFLSIGYAACHWCHVMAHESFEDPQVARMLNEHFVSIKVDREERPDLDSIYMNAVVSLTGQGGWPMSVFLTPDGKPFYGGTYFPPTSRYGLPAFRDLLVYIDGIWQEDRQKVDEAGEQLTQQIKESSLWGSRQNSDLLKSEDLSTATQKLESSYDWQHGGWGGAPRFPAPMTIEFLLQQAVRGNPSTLQVVTHLLKAMQRGGMYDVVGGGFHRYSTDADWLVPHFEKMLYDNAQLALAYLHAYLITREPSFKRTCEETLDFMLRELADPLGGFYSSLDADSEGQEGKFYIWSIDEIESALPDLEELRWLRHIYDITSEGNFEGKTILRRRADDEQLAQDLGVTVEEFSKWMQSIHHRLFTVRQGRMRPHTDDKVLVAWNSLALRVLAQAGKALERPDYLGAAQENANFLLNELAAGDRLSRSWRKGRTSQDGCLEDYAALILALETLYQADGDTRWFVASKQLLEEMKRHFSDPQGGFYDTRSDLTDLVVRPKDIQDNATPSGNALAALAILHLAELDGEMEIGVEIRQLLGTVKDLCLKYPSAFSFWLQAIDFAIGPVRQIALTWPSSAVEPQDFFRVVWEGFHPCTVLAAAAYPPPENVPALLQDRPPIDQSVTAYVCQGFVCRLPTTSIDVFRQMIGQEQQYSG